MSIRSYNAACVRACALRNALLLPQDWEVLGAMSGSGAIIERLKTRGILGGSINGVLAAERAAHESVIRNASGLLRFLKGASAELVRCFVRHYDLLNIENVVQRIHTFPDEGTRPQARFYDTGPFGLLRSSTLDAVTNYPALGHALRRSPFAVAFEAALQRYRQDEDAGRMIERIEIAFFSNWVAAAERCGIRVRVAANVSPMVVFFRAKSVESAVRLKVYRKAESMRVGRWLSLVAPAARADACLELLAGGDRPGLAEDVLAALLPAEAIPPQLDSRPARGKWGVLGRTVMHATLGAAHGITFDINFLTGFLLRQMYQARELTALLESKDADVSVPLSAPGELER